MAAKSKPNEIRITRVYDAPVKMVWDAWVDPKKVAKWWGPRGFTLTSKQKDVRPGGTWTYVMHGPDGTDYPNMTLFHEVEKHSRLVYDHGSDGKSPPLFRVEVDFSELNGKTTMDMRFILATPEAATEMKKFIKIAGGNSTWDRLAEYLTDDEYFFINRTFEAPIEVMFEMWTNPEHFLKWLPPTGMHMKLISADIKPSGELMYGMQADDASSDMPTMYGKLKYLEIRKPDRIVYTQIFCDKNGIVSRHPMAPTWPETMLTTITLSEEESNQTRVTVQWEIHGNATDAERATFQNGKTGMSQGWGGSFEKLEAYLISGKASAR